MDGQYISLLCEVSYKTHAFGKVSHLSEWGNRGYSLQRYSTQYVRGTVQYIWLTPI